MEIAAENRMIDVLTPEEVDRYLKLPRWRRGLHKIAYAYGTMPVDPLDRSVMMMTGASLDFASYQLLYAESRAEASYNAFIDRNPGYVDKCDCGTYKCALGYCGKR
jgi:hypothetical protein